MPRARARAASRWNRSDVDAARREGDVADQDNTCKNGTKGCPGPTGGGRLPCSDCFFEASEDDQQ